MENFPYNSKFCLLELLENIILPTVWIKYLINFFFFFFFLPKCMVIIIAVEKEKSHLLATDGKN